MVQRVKTPVPVLPALLVLLALVGLLGGCVTTRDRHPDCGPEPSATDDCPQVSVDDDPWFDEWLERRTWVPPEVLDIDPIQLAIDAEIPIKSALVKLIGSGEDDPANALAARIAMIERARHSVDAVYYIFKPDLAGKAVLGALCDAAQRGVDVRLMVDSIGSIGLGSRWLRALQSCELGAGFLKTKTGAPSRHRARVQVMIFNALSKVFVNPNRRSHDKLLAIDGHFPERAMVLTGGRNISLSYYGIHADGTPDGDAYRDAEVLLRSGPEVENVVSVGEISEDYFTLLSLYKNNRSLKAAWFFLESAPYGETRAEMNDALARIKTLPTIRAALDRMPQYLEEGYVNASVRLAHEFGNLISKRAITNAVENLQSNPNSIVHLLTQAGLSDNRHSKAVSPYLFAARYLDRQGNVILDEAKEIHEWLDAYPDRTVEIITNSVLTSDNMFAQSIVDMDMAPRLLLDKETIRKWQDRSKRSELSQEFLSSDEWKRLVSNPRLRIYELGRSDDTLLGGAVDYGKLHGKYMFEDDVGFIGTANFDYRSRLFNNEMGFLFDSADFTEQLLEDFERLKSDSYLWGSPEWLAMRAALRERSGLKAWSVRQQRAIYKFLRGTGLHWYF